MCSRVSCQSCGKATWVGCGMHVSSALRGIPTEQRCSNWAQGADNPCKQSKKGSLLEYQEE